MLRAALLLALLSLLGGVAPSSHAASGAEVFRTPSGNIYCGYQHYSPATVNLRCEIRSKIRPLPPKPASCGDAVWGAGYSMRQRGPARVLCISDTIFQPTQTVLSYGTTRQFGVFRCSSSVKGLRCVNSTGNGFFLSKKHSYTYKEPAARYGSFKTPSRNIVCGWSVAPDGSASMECGVKSGLKPPPKPIHCDSGDPNDKRVSLRDTGRATPVLCAGDPGPLLPQIEAKASVLAYGSSTRVGAIRCTSATTGLTCRNRDGHGFFLSRASWRTF